MLKNSGKSVVAKASSPSKVSKRNSESSDSSMSERESESEDSVTEGGLPDE